MGVSPLKLIFHRPFTAFILDFISDKIPHLHMYTSLSAIGCPLSSSYLNGLSGSDSLFKTTSLKSWNLFAIFETAVFPGSLLLYSLTAASIADSNKHFLEFSHLDSLQLKTEWQNSKLCMHILAELLIMHNYILQHRNKVRWKI